VNKIIPRISLGVLLLSAVIYVAGRWIIADALSDDEADWLLWPGGIAALVLLYVATSNIPPRFWRGINIASATTIAALVMFGAWGLLTDAGQRQFPEMAGMLPFFALALAAALLVWMGIANVIWRRNQ
jgi:hypothetical protein